MGIGRRWPYIYPDQRNIRIQLKIQGREWLQGKIQGMSIFDRINYAVDEENKHYRERRLEEF